MSKRFKLAASIGVVALVTAIAVGASQAKTSAPATAKASTVVLSGWGSTPTEEQLLRKVIASFEAKNPSIHVDYAPISGDYTANMLAKFSARKPPDVFYVDGNVAPTWEAQGVLQPLESYINQSHFSLKPFFPKLLGAFRYKGHIYGLPKDWSPLGMEVNIDILSKARLKAPRNWKELTGVATKLNNGNFIPGGAPVCLSADWARLLAFVYQNKGSFLNASRTKATLLTSQVKGAVNYYLSFVNKGLAAPPDKLGASWCGEAFGKGKAAIAFEGNWIVPYLQSTFPNLRFAIKPMPKGKVNGNLAFTVSYSIGKDSKNKAAAWKLLQYLTGKQGMATWTSLGLALPSRSDVKPVGGRGPFLQAAPFAQPWQFAPGFDKVITTANNELTAVFQFKESVNTMLKNIQQAANQALHGG